MLYHFLPSFSGLICLIGKGHFSCSGKWRKILLLSHHVTRLISSITFAETQTLKEKKNRKKRAQKKISSGTTSSAEAAASMKVIKNHAKDSYAIDSANARGPSADTLKLYGIQDESSNVRNYFDDNDMEEKRFVS
ncbi:hypothetical protein AgCh_014837 [Apium graveolens]